MCPLLPTKPSPTTRQADEMVERIQRLARERDSGFFRVEGVRPLEWELLLIWDESVEMHRRANDAQTRALLQALIQRPM